MNQYPYQLLICILCMIGAMSGFAHDSGPKIEKHPQSYSDATPNHEEDLSNEYAYRPLLTDGKKWTVLHGVPQWGEFYIIHVKVSGDCVMDGKNCKKLIVNLETPKAKCPCIMRTRWEDGMEIYAYEEDRRIYVYHNPYVYYSYITNELTNFKGYWDIYMDFNIRKGDMINNFYEVSDECHMQIGNEFFRTLYFDIHTWIEGIGCPDLYNIWSSRYADDEEVTLNGRKPFYLWKCEENGKLIYDDTDLLKREGLLDFVAGVEDVTTGDDKTSVKIYNLQGLPVDRPQKGCPYILNGKKIIF